MKKSYFILLPLPFLIVSCRSSTKAISNAATEAQVAAQSTIDHLHTISTSGSEITNTAGTDSIVQPMVENIQEHTALALNEQQKILGVAATIHHEIPGVKDVTPWWGTLLGRLALAAAVVAVCFLLWYSGIGTLIRTFLAGFGLLIPKATAIRAKFDAENIESGQASAARKEAVAATRGADPVYDKLYRKEQSRIRVTRPR